MFGAKRSRPSEPKPGECRYCHGHAPYEWTECVPCALKHAAGDDMDFEALTEPIVPGSIYPHDDLDD